MNDKGEKEGMDPASTGCVVIHLDSVILFLSYAKFGDFVAGTPVFFNFAQIPIELFVLSSNLCNSRAIF